jgi:hypothetical protein
MASTLNKLYVKTFELIVRQLAQQTDSRLRPWVAERTETGSTRNWPRIAKRGAGGALVAKNGATATPQNNSVFSNRVSVVATYHDADQTEQEDINQVLIDPNSTIATSLGAQARRTVDDVIIAAATGNALDEAGNNNAFPASQVFGDYNTEIDFAAITNVAEMFLANDILPDEEKVAVVGPQQARKLLHIAQATNSQFVGQAMALINNGWVDRWMGFRWILSNRLLKPLPGQISCLFMTRKALGLQIAKDIWAKVAEDPSQSFAWRIYVAMAMGAVRVEDEHIVAGYFKDTCTVA